MSLSNRTRKVMKAAIRSKKYAKEICDGIDLGPSPAVKASFSGLVDLANGSFTLTVSADVAGAAGNDSIIGDGISDCDTLIGALPEAYTVSAGGSEILGAGITVNIIGGLDAVEAQFSGQVTGMTTDVTIDADVAGVAGNVTLVADSISDIDDLIAAWNIANPANTVTLSLGDGSQVPTADITLSGGADAVAASFNGLTQSEGGTALVTIEADVAGAASNDSITGDGVSDVDALVAALSESYTVSAGGSEVPELNEVINITGGINDGDNVTLSSEAKRYLKIAFCDKTASDEFISIVQTGSEVSMSERTSDILRIMLADKKAWAEIVARYA